MASFIAKTALFAATAVIAAPASHLVTRQQQNGTDDAEAWDAGLVTEYTIHESCNVTQAAQIADGLREAVELAAHARDHILRWGNESEIYQRYFGNDHPYTTIGAYEIVVNGNKEGVIFRCDNPDGNCGQEGWAGHWRGSNATQETVICDLSYQTRRWLNSMCGMGYNVANSPTNTYWASDLLHRLYHVPSIGGGYLEHYLETYQDLLDTAGQPGSNNTFDSDALQYFALDAYAYDIAVPGEGCPGVYEEPESDDDDAAVTTTTAATGSVEPTPTDADAATGTIDIPPNCHTHEGGELHCP